MKTFKEWLQEEGALPSRLRPELDPDSIKRDEISLGDIVELGPETEHKGQKINRIGQVVEIRAREVIVNDLTRKDKKYAIDVSELHDKEELKGIILTPYEERHLKLLGGKKLWVRLTPRQYKKFKSQYQSKLKPIMPEDQPEEDDSVLRTMFSKKPSEPDAPKMKILEPETPVRQSPLRRYIRKDLF
jgi:hypothetical protein